MSPVPRLVPRPTARSLRLLGLVLPGIREITAQIEPYTAWWDDQNQRAAEGSGPLLVAIGDSTAIGVGASAPSRSYVGLLRTALAERDGRTWRAVNLALSGARLDDAVERQLPAVLGLEPDLVTCCIGTNDLVWGRETTELRTRLRELVTGLPIVSVIGSLAGSSTRGQSANRALRNAAAKRDLPVVNPWAESGPPPRHRLAADRFHPNDLGYELMARPFGRHLGIEYPGAPRVTDDPQAVPEADLSER
ncbi:MAG: SGNH/GDSL hydrolase family protein [Acidimicrobiia bacterium]|nr:SGNH/GDSL hydrolase family protein [Acidimicrobiia bacterium]